MVAGVGWLLMNLIASYYGYKNKQDDWYYGIIIGLLGLWFCLAEAGVRGSDFYPMYPYR